MFQKIYSFCSKLLHGGHPIKIKYSPESWDAQFSKGNWSFLQKDHENLLLISHYLTQMAQNKQGTKYKIFDVGCGNGSLAKRLSSNLFDYTGSDISAEALREAEQVAPWGTFFQSDIDEAVQKTDQKFDAIIFCEVLVYVDYEKVIERYRGLLADNGVFVISLYDVWRTKLIWFVLKRRLQIRKAVFVKDKSRKVGWNIVIAACSK